MIKIISPSFVFGFTFALVLSLSLVVHGSDHYDLEDFKIDREMIFMIADGLGVDPCSDLNNAIVKSEHEILMERIRSLRHNRIGGKSKD